MNSSIEAVKFWHPNPSIAQHELEWDEWDLEEMAGTNNP